METTKGFDLFQLFHQLGIKFKHESRHIYAKDFLPKAHAPFLKTNASRYPKVLCVGLTKHTSSLRSKQLGDMKGVINNCTIESGSND